MKVVITGGTGHIGLNVIKACLRRGWQVRATYRDPQFLSHPILKNLDVEWVAAELLDLASLEKAFAQQEAAIHVAAPNKVAVSDSKNEIEKPIVEGTQNAMKAAESAGLKKFVMTSSCSAVGTKTTLAKPFNETQWNWQMKSPLLLSKVVAEDWAWKNQKQFSFQLYSACLPAVIGPGFLRWTSSTQVLKTAMNGFVPPLPKVGFHWLDSRDAAEGHVLCLEKTTPSGRFIFAGDYVDSSSYLKNWQRAEKNIRSLPFTLPNWGLKTASWAEGIRAKVQNEPSQFPKVLMQDLLNFEQHMDSTKARRELGWSSRPLTQTLQESLSWARALEKNQWDKVGSLV